VRHFVSRRGGKPPGVPPRRLFLLLVVRSGKPPTHFIERDSGDEEVCQPQQAKKVPDADMSVSTALPCRISIYEEDGKTILATLKPTTLLAMFNVPQLKEVAQEVEDTIVKIMKEAASV